MQNDTSPHCYVCVSLTWWDTRPIELPLGFYYDRLAHVVNHWSLQGLAIDFHDAAGDALELEHAAVKQPADVDDRTIR